MPGQNAFAFNGTAFVPEDRNLTAALRARATPTTFSGVSRAYTLSAGNPATQFWLGFPPQAVITGFRNVRTGSAPNLANSIWVDFSCDTSTLTASFTVFVSIGGGAYSPVATLLSTDREYNYGYISANTTYSFYIRTNGIAGQNTTSSASSTSLAGAALVSTISGSQTTTTATVSWTVPASTYQEFYVYDNATLLATVSATELGTSYSYTRTGLTEGFVNTFRVYGKNKDGFTSGYREQSVTTNTVPTTTIYWEDAATTRYSNFRVFWTGSTGVTYEPQYSPDNSTWYALGSAQSGSGTKYSDYLSPSYADDHFIRVKYYTDGETIKYTNVRSVTPGRVQIDEFQWSGEYGPFTDTYAVNTPTSIPNGTPGASTIAWGNATALSLTGTTSTDYRVSRFRVNGTRITSGVSLSSTSRRIAVKTASDTSANRTTSFDSAANNTWIEFGSTWGYQSYPSAAANQTARTWGVRDNISYWDSGQARWEYSDSQANFWPSGRVTWTAEIQYYYRTYSLVTVQTHVPSTYT